MREVLINKYSKVLQDFILDGGKRDEGILRKVTQISMEYASEGDHTNAIYLLETAKTGRYGELDEFSSALIKKYRPEAIREITRNNGRSIDAKVNDLKKVIVYASEGEVKDRLTQAVSRIDNGKVKVRPIDDIISNVYNHELRYLQERISEHEVEIEKEYGKINTEKDERLSKLDKKVSYLDSLKKGSKKEVQDEIASQIDGVKNERTNYIASVDADIKKVRDDLGAKIYDLKETAKMIELEKVSYVEKIRNRGFDKIGYRKLEQKLEVMVED